MLDFFRNYARYNYIIPHIDDFTEQWPASSYGPAHIVLDDYNLENRFVHFCLEEIESYDPRNYSQEHSPEELEATRELLEWLLTLPECFR